MSFPTEYPYKYTIKKDSPYYRDFIPDQMFEGIWAKGKQMSLGFLCQYDPSNAELYKENFPKIFPELDKDWFKDSFKEMFVGCTDPQSGSFQVQMRSLVAKMANYARFLIERMLHKEEIEAVPIKNPMYIINLPRSGSTFTHRVLANDPTAKVVRMYQHVSAGSQTMNLEARKKITELIIGQIQDDGKDMNKVHNLDNVNAPEEELFFMEILACSYLFGSAMPRWEQYRESAFTRNWDDVYYAVLDDMRMSAIEDKMTEKQHFLMKSVNHFMTPIPFFKIMCQDKFEPRIVWIHREPVDEFKSCFYLLLNTRARYKGDIGEEDMKWLQETILEMNEISLRNAIYIREHWIAENPERKKYIIDMAFKEMITDPIAASKKIYDYFGMEVTDEMVEGIKETVEKKDPQGKHRRKVKKDDEFFISDEQIRDKFKWYYEKFSEYLPNYWEKKE